VNFAISSLVSGHRVESMDLLDKARRIRIAQI